MTEDKVVNEREQTDESLRVERARTDHAFGEELAAIDETADAVICKARMRADAVVAAARAKSDRAPPSPSAPSHATIARERLLEDRVLEHERADADEALRLERAQHLALLSSQRDMTDRDLSSERARSDDSLATRDAFLGIVSHDLRDMLTAVVGYAALIAKGLPEANVAERTHALRIQRAGARMNRLVGDLVDVASIEAGMLAVTRERGDPADVVAEAVDTFQVQALASGIALTADIVASPSLVDFDPARILQVLVNLLSNAFKFTSKGKIVVRVEHAADDLRISVVDSGQGIPADKLVAIFDRFHQVGANDRRGVGLGLYISKCILQGHGGRIWAESRVGEGSTFSFTLPLQTPS